MNSEENLIMYICIIWLCTGLQISANMSDLIMPINFNSKFNRKKRIVSIIGGVITLILLIVILAETLKR